MQMQVPDFMREDSRLGTEEMGRFIVPPRMVIVQPLSKAPFDSYEPGSVVVMPNEIVVGRYNKPEGCLDEPFLVVPVFFFAQYTLDNPKKLWDTLGRIRESSFDHDSEVAIKAQNYNLREIPCPEDKTQVCTYTTRLNFMLYVPKIQNVVMVTFKRAEMRTGMDFNSLIKMRNAPICGGQYIVDVSKRENDKGLWYGLNISNPPKEIGGWVKDPVLYETLKRTHEELKTAHASKLIRPSDEPVEGDGEPGENQEF